MPRSGTRSTRVTWRRELEYRGFRVQGVAQWKMAEKPVRPRLGR